MPGPKTNVFGEAMDWVCCHKSHIAGLSHPNKRGSSRKRLARRLRVGTQLVLKADPNNPADQDAVLIYRADDPVNDLGYLYSYTARSVARKMRCGATFSAEVSEVDGDSEYPVIRIHVYQLTKTTSMEEKRPSDQYYSHAQYAYGDMVKPANYAPAQRQVEEPVEHQEEVEFNQPEAPRRWWQRLFG